MSKQYLGSIGKKVLYGKMAPWKASHLHKYTALRNGAPELGLCREIPWNGHRGSWKRASSLLLEFIVTLVAYYN